MRTCGDFHILRAPVILRAAVDHIPSQIIDRNHLGGTRGSFTSGHSDFPAIAVPDDVQVLGIRKRADDRGPVQLQLHLGIVLRMHAAAALQSDRESHRSEG